MFISSFRFGIAQLALRRVAAGVLSTAVAASRDDEVVMTTTRRRGDSNKTANRKPQVGGNRRKEELAVRQTKIVKCFTVVEISIGTITL